MTHIIDTETSSFIKLDWSAHRREELSPADGASIDQLQAGILDLWTEADIDPEKPSSLEGRQRKFLAGLSSMLTLQAVEARTMALLRGQHITHQTAAAVSCVLDEVRMALSGFVTGTDD